MDALKRIVRRRPRGRPRHDDILTPREWQVFRLLEERSTNKEIAARMGISENGAKYHVAEIISKQGVNTRQEAVARLHEQTRPRIGIVVWLGRRSQGHPVHARTMLAIAASLLILSLCGLVYVLTAGSFVGGSDVGTTPVPGEDDTSDALADFLGNPGEPSEARFDDPFAYCLAAGTIDAPDSRYVGPRNDAALNEKFADAVGIAADAGIRDDLSSAGSRFTWRCADGQLLVCTYGNNIPCDAKADISTEPTQALKDYCAAAGPPPSDPSIPNYIPANVTGRATIYLWECEDGAPAIAEQATEADGQGYLALFWYHVLP
jgi:DNA-binding CsgD family transcriptional regulator